MSNHEQDTERQAHIDRERVEWVFGLTGGELNDKPLEYTYDDGAQATGRFLYHYDGLPDWCARDYRDRYDNHVEYLTVVCDLLYSGPPKHITVDSKVYDCICSYGSSGETECPCRDMDEDPYADETCPLCKRAVGEKHGHIYIGDGWCEVVYRHDGVQAMRDVCTAHNIQVWNDHEVTVTCQSTDCGNVWMMPEDTARQHPDARRCPDCDEPGAIDDRGMVRYWWQTCSPGCLPDSSVMGPFDSEIEALEDATEGLK